MKKLFVFLLFAFPATFLLAQDALPAPAPQVSPVDLQTVLTAAVIYGLTWLVGYVPFLKGLITTPFIRAVSVSIVTAVLSALVHAPDAFWHQAGLLFVTSGPLAGWAHESIKVADK